MNRALYQGEIRQLYFIGCHNKSFDWNTQIYSWLDLVYSALSELVECSVLFQNILRLFYSTMHSIMKFYYAKHTAPYTHRSTGTFLQLAFYPLFLVELVLQFSPPHTAYIHADKLYGCKPSPKCRSFVISKLVPL